ncbi:uncharacterized protein LOC144587560 [Pogona vitticeps]
MNSEIREATVGSGVLQKISKMKLMLFLGFSFVLIFCSFAQPRQPVNLKCFYCAPRLPDRCFFVYEDCVAEAGERCQITTVYRGDAIHYVARGCTNPTQREHCDMTTKDPVTNMTTIVTCCDKMFCNRVPATLP